MNAPNEILFKVQDCSFNYAERTILQSVSAEFRQGRMYGLIGPNGSGKTTLISLLAGILRPLSGSIFYKDKEIFLYPKSVLAREIAMVPQSFSMEFDYTVFEVVMMGRHPYIPRFSGPAKEDMALVDRAIAMLDIEHLRNRYLPNLSGGEHQRVLVARAIAQNTPVMILDEATASLDIRHAIDIMAALRHKVDAEGVMVIAAVHDLEMAAAFCDELVVLKEGRVHAAGPVAGIMSEEMLDAVFNVGAKVEIPDTGQPRIRYSY